MDASTSPQLASYQSWIEDRGIPWQLVVARENQTKPVAATIAATTPRSSTASGTLFLAYKTEHQEPSHMKLLEKIKNALEIEGVQSLCITELPNTAFTASDYLVFFDLEVSLDSTLIRQLGCKVFKTYDLEDMRKRPASKKPAWVLLKAIRDKISG